MKNSDSKGKQGEEIATNFLIKKDYKIIQRNYNTKFGEIDIICRHNNILVFVEVKTRSSKNEAQIFESINSKKIDRLKKAASLYLQQTKDSDSVCRFDAIFIKGMNEPFEIIHIESAF